MPTGEPSPLLANRIREGVELWEAGLAPVLVMSGGLGADGFDEAVVMRDVAVAAGVPADAIVVDSGGVTTEATVVNTIALLAARGVPGDARPLRLLAVTQAYHLPRVELAFQAGGVDVLTVPATDRVPIRQMPLYVLREIPAFWAYFLSDCFF